MKAGLVVLCLGYVLSQFFRAFLAVLSVDLGRDIGATAEDLVRIGCLRARRRAPSLP